MGACARVTHSFPSCDAGGRVTYEAASARFRVRYRTVNEYGYVAVRADPAKRKPPGRAGALVEMLRVEFEDRGREVRKYKGRIGA
jgi:hypothetical protein